MFKNVFFIKEYSTTFWLVLMFLDKPMHQSRFAYDTTNKLNTFFTVYIFLSLDNGINFKQLKVCDRTKHHKFENKFTKKFLSATIYHPASQHFSAVDIYCDRTVAIIPSYQKSFGSIY